MCRPFLDIAQVNMCLNYLLLIFLNLYTEVNLFNTDIIENCSIY